MSKKLVIVGLDGATLNIIKPFIQTGRLKTFKRIIDRGVSGELASTRPPLTCPAWPSFMTGKNPGKYGVGDFILEGEEGERVVSFRDIDAEPFWDTAGREGRKSIIVNVPITYPPRIGKGFLISGMMTPPNHRFWSDDTVMQAIERSVGNYIMDLDIFTLVSLNTANSLNKLIEMMQNQFRTALHLRDHYPFDLFTIVFRTPDIVCHRLWDRRDVILRVYEMIDGFLEVFLGDDCNLLIMSDHGFSGFPKGVRINQYLEDLGVVVKKKAASKYGFSRGSVDIEKRRFGTRGEWVHRMARVPMDTLLRLGVTRNTIAEILARMGLYDQARNRFPRVLKRMVPQSIFTVDRPNSKAYLHSRRTRSIKVNRDFFPTSPEYEAFREFLRDRLMALKDDETGERVIANVFTREEIYRGDYVDRLPDLYVEPREDYLLVEDFGQGIVYEFIRPRSTHDPRGVFIAYGPDIAECREIEEAEIIDLAPTALHLLDVAIPADLDGKVLWRIFRDGSGPLSRPARHSAPLRRTVLDEVTYTETEEETMKDVLRALGYMD